MFKTEPGSTNELNQVTVAKTDENASPNAFIRSVSALATVAITLSTAFTSPRIGDRHRVLATGGDVTVLGGTYPLLGSGFVPQGSSADYELADSANGLVWVEMAGGGALGVGEILVPNIAALAALPASLPNKIYARVLTYDQPSELDRASTAAPDGITIVPALGGGNWLRMETFNKRWSTAYLAGAYVDPVNGNDENDGLTANTATKTVAEICRRLHQMQAGKNYTINVLNDVPAQEADLRPFATAYVRDQFRPSACVEQNPASISATTGVEQVFNMTLAGQQAQTVVATITGTYTASDGTDQAILGGLSPADYALVAANIGAFVRNPATGASTVIGKALGVNSAFVSAITGTAPVGATTLEIVQKTKWNPSLLQVGWSQGRFLFTDLEFPAADPAPADQQDIAQRTTSVTFQRCLFRRVWQLDFNESSTLSGCSAVFSSLTNVPVIGGAITYLNTALINVVLRPAFGLTVLQIVGLYLQNGALQTFLSAAVPTYGASISAGATSGAKIIVAGGVTGGLSVYDWGAGDGVLLSDGAFMRTSAPIRGSSSTAGSCGVSLRSQSHLLIAASQTANMTITANVAQVRIRNPLGTLDFAVRAGQGAFPVADPVTQANFEISSMAIASAGPVVLDCQQLSTWNNLFGVGATQFNGYAFNPQDGSSIGLSLES